MKGEMRYKDCQGNALHASKRVLIKIIYDQQKYLLGVPREKTQTDPTEWAGRPSGMARREGSPGYIPFELRGVSKWKVFAEPAGGEGHGAVLSACSSIRRENRVVLPFAVRRGDRALQKSAPVKGS